jgi:small-conductance mechanosensitive channel
MQKGNPLLMFETYKPYLLNGLQVLIVFLIAYLSVLIAVRAIRTLRKQSVRMMLKAGAQAQTEVEKRAETIANVIRKVVVLLIWATAFMMALQKLGFAIGPLLASFGLLGVALGFGAQNLVKDVLAGLFLLFENQIRVNDSAVINGTGGLVESINLRTTVLRGETGAVHIFANGSIQTLSNLTRDYSYFVFELLLDYSADTDQAIAALQEIAESVASEEPYKAVVLAQLEVIGLDKLGESGVVVKARFKTLPGKQWPLGREMNRRIKKRFGEPGIEIPFPIRTVHVVQELSPALREELKRVVKEVVAERESGVGSRESGG